LKGISNMQKDTWVISLTPNEWRDLMETLRSNDPSLAETLVEQISEQLEAKLN
jgi:hypothetical protein